MKVIRQILLPVLCFFIFSGNSSASGPLDRSLTDPQSVASVSNPAARPVPIDSQDSCVV